MDDRFTKDIIISCAKEEPIAAEKLYSVLKDLYEEDAWLQRFDLNGGEIITDAITRAVSLARWFLLVLTKASAQSKWVQAEATLATFRAIESEDFRIIILQLEDVVIPPHFKAALTKLTVWDLRSSKDLEGDFIRLADQISKERSTLAVSKIYVGRGEASDQFAVAARRNKIIFLVGFPGIGKTAFCHHSVANVLNRRPLALTLSRGHSSDLLIRQLLKLSHVAQPVSEEPINETELIGRAINAMATRSDKFYLLLDNAEDVLGADNSLPIYLDDIIQNLTNSVPDLWVVIASTRLPDYSANMGKTADILRLGLINSVYIREAIDLWLENDPRHDQLMKIPELQELVDLAGGHPLAAKLLASQLRTDKAVDELLTARQKRRFELKLAVYILRLTDHNLNDIEKSILEILAVVSDPLTMQDLLSLEIIKQYDTEEVQAARSRLSDRFLIQQQGELMYLHKFLEVYFKDSLFKDQGKRKLIAQQYGLHAYNQALSANHELTRQLKSKQNRGDGFSIELSNNVFRYAVPAARLLRSVGRVDLADKLPIQVKGTLREMVFYFYQEERDYQKALEYAEKWLAVHPNDLEIKLFQVRCYRNERGGAGLQKATKILKELEEHSQRHYLSMRILRERGLVEEHKGNMDTAKDFYRRGIDQSHYGTFYIENHVSLAKLLLREGEHSAQWMNTQTANKEALDLLEIARSNSSTFDRFYLGVYADALIQNGREDEAMPLLKDSLVENPSDPQLNYRLAEILRKRSSLKEAEFYAREAIRNGSKNAVLTLANILCTRAVQQDPVNSASLGGFEFLKSALRVLEGFHPEYGTDQEVADAIKAKIYRLLGDWNNARKVVTPYSNTSNVFMVYEQCKVHLWFADKAAIEGQKGLASTEIELLLEKISVIANKQPISEQLEELRILAEERKSRRVIGL